MKTEEQVSKIGYREILKQKEYMKTIIAAVINRFGDAIDSIAFTWLVYQVTQSAAWSAIIFGVNRIPTIFLQPFAGALIKGKNKKSIMILTDIIRGVCVGFVSTALLFGFVNQWNLLGATIIISCAEAFRGPASNSLLPKLLDKKYYEFGLSLNSSACSIMELLGVGIAGVIIGQFGTATAIYIDAATFVISALIIVTLKVEKEEKIKEKLSVNHYLNDLKDGFVYIKGKKILVYFIATAIFLNGILVPYNSLQGPLVTEVLHSNEMMLSVIGIAIGIGMILGATCYPYIRQKVSNSIMICLGCFSIGIYYFALVISGKYITISALLYAIIALSSFILGLLVALLMAFVNIEFMKTIEEDYLARASALLNAGCVASIPLVSFIVGAGAKGLSTQVLFILAGTIGILGCFYLCSPKKLKLVMETEDKIVAEEIKLAEEVNDIEDLIHAEVMKETERFYEI